MLVIDFLALSVIIGSWIFSVKNPNYSSVDFSRYKRLIPYTREFEAHTEK